MAHSYNINYTMSKESEELCNSSNNCEKYNEFSYTEELAMKKDTELPRMHQVDFECNSKTRRNVNKCIIRFILKNYDKEELKARYDKYGFKLDQHAAHTLDEIKAKERCRISIREKNSGSKDYRKLLRMLMCYKNMRTIVKCCMESLYCHLEKNEYKGIKRWNRDTYMRTVKDYILYIEDIEKKIAKPNK
eukprot:TRINITY_DN6389_c0_g1_i3.p1 TRINITY_DN6389_c0_g1~~TRINITY_DN6389_c0_g1_i3.p1  ORF type:complete len:190 (+),score=58.72 TRINITY_DN6389_c0_g1_i3:158-727(+)